jgi:ABC-type sugar transport system permease subunit
MPSDKRPQGKAVLRNASSLFQAFLEKLKRFFRPIESFFKGAENRINRLGVKKRETIYGLLFVSPWIIGYAMFNLYPLVYSLYLSLNKVTVSLISGIQTTYIGFDNYVNAINESPDLMNHFINYIRNVIVSIPLMLVIAVFLALLVNQKIKGKGIFRMIYFFPVIIISGPVIRDLQAYGALNLTSLVESRLFVTITSGFSGFLQDMVVYAFANIILFLWYSGVQTIIFLSGLQKIDQQLYEAARVDGASPWEIFWKITLPAIKPLFAVNIIYSIVLITNTIDNPILGSARYHMFQNPLTGYGFGSAIAWLLFALEIVLLAVLLFIFRSKDKEVKGA